MTPVDNDLKPSLPLASFPIPLSDPTFQRVYDFLVREAALLDACRFSDWYSMLHEELSYRMPTRVTTHLDDGPGFTKTMHFDETYASIGGRIGRLGTKAAWAEDPPSRTRRFVTNVTVTVDPDSPGDINVTSYLLVTRSRWDSPSFELIPVERHDVLRESDNGELKLRRRLILTDQTNLGTVNLALFL